MVEMGESMKQMADAKYSLDDNIKQNFLEPLHHLQTKDLKEVMVCGQYFLYSVVKFTSQKLRRIIPQDHLKSGEQT